MKIFFRGLLFFFGMVLCGEIFLRVFSPQPSFQNHSTTSFGLPNAFQKNLDIDVDFDGFPFKIITDSRQLRSFQKVDYKKSPDTFRILCIGGSIFAASGVNNDETFAFYLNEILKDRIPDQKFEVINAAKTLWELPEFYTYLKNEGYKYSPDLVVIYEHRGEFSSMQLKKYEAENLKVETISENSIRLSFKIFHFNFYFNQATATALGLIHNLPFYKDFFDLFHLLRWFEKFCLDRLNKTEEDIQSTSERTSVSSALSGLNLSEKSKINWVSPNGEIKDSSPRNLKWDVYSLSLNQFMDLAEKLNSKTLFLRVAAREEILKINTRSEFANLISLKERESSTWLNFFEPMVQFQSSQAFPLNFPNHIHWTPAGHRLAAFLAFNSLIEKKLIPFKNNIDEIKIDLANSKWIDQIASANSRINPFLDRVGYSLFIKGIFQNNNNQRPEAIKTFKTYLQKFPNNPEARMQLAVTLLEEGNASTALKFLTPILDLKKAPEASFFYLLGKTYFKLKKWDQALSNFEKYRKQHPKDPKIYHFLGLIHFQNKNYSEAQKNYLKSIELKPGYTSYINRLGSFYYDLGQLEAAQIQFQNSLKLNSNQTKIWLLSGLTSLRLNNPKKALYSMEKVLKLNPTNSMALDIIKKIKTALKDSPSNAK